MTGARRNRAFSASELDEARRLLDDLITEARQADDPPVYLPIRDDDPGRILLVLQIAASRRAIAEAAQAARREAIDAVYREASGRPRSARPARGLVALTGEPGVVVPAGASARSDDGRRVVALARRAPVLLAGLSSCEVRLADGSPRDASWLIDADALRERTPDPFASLAGVRLGLVWGTAAPRARHAARPGLLAWDVPPELGRRLVAVTALYPDGTETPLRIVRDRRGRILIALRGRGRQLPAQVELRIDVPPAQQRLLGRFLANIVVGIETATTGASEAPELTSPSPRRRDWGVIEPFGPRAWPGRAAEAIEAWRRRAAREIRIGSRVVTADDVRETVERRHPDIAVVETAACRIGPPGRRMDGLRVTILPRSWDDDADAAIRAEAAADRVVETLRRRLPPGVAARVGPPRLNDGGEPPTSDADGLLWPVLDLARMAAVVGGEPGR